MLVTVLSFAVGGAFALLLGMARTPVVTEYLPYRDFFYTALVVHVDLTVLVWFLGATCLWWHIYIGQAAKRLQKRAFGLFSIGFLLMIVAPFTEAEAGPLLNNYVPILQLPLFYAALWLLSAGVVTQLALVLYYVRPWQCADAAGAWLVWGSGMMVAAASLALLLSMVGLMGGEMHPHDYFERLFWATGHMLQFNHTHLLIALWGLGLLLIGSAMPILGWMKGIIIVMIPVVLAGLVPLLIWPVVDGRLIDFYTWQMIIFGAIYVLPFGWLALKGGGGKHPKIIR